MAATTAPPLQFPSPSGTAVGLPSAGQSSQNAQILASQQYQPYYLRPAYRFKTNTPQSTVDMMVDGPGRRLRKNVANVRRHIDYTANVLNHVEARLYQLGARDRLAVQPDILYQNCCLPAASTLDKPVDCVLTKFVRAAMNKVKCPIYSICWTPEGKRLITGASTGEFTLWNGTAFNFETILQAHDVAIRALKWSHNDQWLVSADHDGFVKYWQPNMNNVHMYQAHKDEPIRSLSFAPTDVKLVTGSDDGTARIWDFARCAEERILRGHGSDVRSVDWHPQKGLICTGSRDSQQPVKLWDPKSGLCLSTLHDHKNSVMAVQWNRNGNWLLTGSRDHLIKMYDIRMMREMHTYRGHKKEVTSLAWHPLHESLFVSGGGDGSLAYWLVNSEKELAFLEHAHDQAIWTLEWHPLGHILASGSNDNNTKFWARNRPGDTQEDIFGLASLSGAVTQSTKETKPDGSEEVVTPVIPGMGLDDAVFQGMQNREAHAGPGGPLLPNGPLAGPLLMPEDPNARQQATNIGAKRTLIKQPPPKKAQRQFERMWNVAKPGGGDDFDEEMPEPESFRRPKASLLGPPPPSMLSTSKPAESQRPYSPVTTNGSKEEEHVGPGGSRGLPRQHGRRSPVHSSQNASESSQGPMVSAANSPLLGSASRLPAAATVQQWAGPSAQPPVIQQVSAPAAAAPVIKQEILPIPQLPQIRPPAMQQVPPLPFPQPTINGPLLWPPPVPLVPSSAQNLDIDYRMGPPPPLTLPPAVVTQGASSSGDVDLRSQQQPSSSSWRPVPTPSADISSHNSDPSHSPGGTRVHDPRMRRGTSQNQGHSPHGDRGESEQSQTRNAAPPQMRDPRRRPQNLTQRAQSPESDYGGRFESSKGPPSQRTWMPNISDSSSQPYNGPRSGSPSLMRNNYGKNTNNGASFEDYDGRQQQHPPYQQYQGGGPVRRGLIDRGRGRGRGPRSGF